MVKKIRRKVKKIAMKASLVSMELEDITEENEEHKQTLANDFKKEFAFIEWKRQQEKLKAEQELQEKEQDSEEEPESESPEEDEEEILEQDNKPSDTPDELKKLYRAIAQKTHPDKTTDERLNEIFKLSADAMKEENWMALVEFAGELNLDIEFLSDETCAKVEESIDRNQKKIIGIKNTFSYIWSRQKNEQDRGMFKTMFYQNFNINVQEYEEWLKSNPS